MIRLYKKILLARLQGTQCFQYAIATVANCLTCFAKMSTTNSNPTNLFPTIGTIAEKADKNTKDGTDQSVSTNEAPEAEQEEKVVQEIDSLCMRCEEQGVTRMLLTSIPFFREIIVMSFRCEHCGWQNNEVQSAGSIRRTFFYSVSSAN